MEYTVSVEIEAPVEKVWATLIDVEQWPRWTGFLGSRLIRRYLRMEAEGLKRRCEGGAT